MGELFEEHLGGGKSTRRYCDVGGPADCKPPPPPVAAGRADRRRMAADRRQPLPVLAGVLAFFGALRFDY